MHKTSRCEIFIFDHCSLHWSIGRTGSRRRPRVTAEPFGLSPVRGRKEYRPALDGRPGTTARSDSPQVPAAKDKIELSAFRETLALAQARPAPFTMNR